MTEVTDLATGERHTYAYDPLGRRIEKTLDADGTPETTRYFYDMFRLVEEQDDGGATLATYVHGRYVDDVLT
ncbi:MAG: hypothetical protein AAF492_31845, partial [Verrucomicrobiota bacterium]